MLRSLIGKEGNKLVERQSAVTTDPADYRVTYTDPNDRRWRDLVVPVLREIRDLRGTGYLVREVGVTDRTIRSWLNTGSLPHAGQSQNQQRAENLALTWALDDRDDRETAAQQGLYVVLYEHLHRD